MNVPLRSSATACCSSAFVFMTIGPYQATGSSIGLPDTSRKRMPSSPACDRDLVAAVEHHQRPVAGLLANERVSRRRRLLGQDAERLRRLGERARSLEHIGEGVPAGLHGQGLAPARRDGDVEIARIRRDTVDRAALAPELAADHPHAGAVVIDDLGDLDRRDVLVAWRGHLERRGQVGPQLEAVHAAAGVALRHLLVENAAARGHPLHVAGAQLASGSRGCRRDRPCPPGRR